MEGMERPRRPAVSSTRGMSKRELAALLACAKTYNPSQRDPQRFLSPDSTYAMLCAYIHHLRASGSREDILPSQAAAWMLAKGWRTERGYPHKGASNVLALMAQWGEVNKIGRGRYRETAQLGAQRSNAADQESDQEPGIAAKRAYALLMTLTATAGRIGAILAADASDVGDDDGYRILTLTVKGDERKRFVLPPPAVAAIEDYLNGRKEGPLFATSTGKRMSGKQVGELIRGIAARAGISQAAKLSPHSMRHTVATILLRDGTELQFVQGLLGHARPETTQIYAHGMEDLDLSPAGRMTDLITAEMRLLEAERA